MPDRVVKWLGSSYCDASRYTLARPMRSRFATSPMPPVEQALDLSRNDALRAALIKIGTAVCHPDGRHRTRHAFHRGARAKPLHYARLIN
jgi:hypothetical protein